MENSNEPTFNELLQDYRQAAERIVELNRIVEAHDRAAHQSAYLEIEAIITELEAKYGDPDAVE
jgi:hypothetical protein